MRFRSLLLVAVAAASCATTAQEERTTTIAQPEALDTFGIGSGRDGDFTVPAAGTVLNSYAPIANVDPTAAQVTIGAVQGAAAGFAAGNLVLVWHTTGLAAATSGDQTAIPLAGDVAAYEFARIKSVTASVLTLTNPLSTAAGFASGSQVVRVPEYKTLTLGPTASAAAYPWDGSSGGIVAIFATVAVANAGAIQADAAGFRGGGIENAAVKAGCVSLNNWSAGTPCGGAHKGEGLYPAGFAVANPGAPGAGPATTYGRGNYANGAGGGDAHNAGGGGGGHAGTGGMGGRTWIGDVNGGGPRFVGGLGGATVTYSVANHLVLGGGGGAGEENDDVGTSGAAGGGVVLIRAGSLTGNGTVSAAGGSVTAPSGVDGSGGGGAGGAVLIQVQGGAACGSASAGGGSGGSGSLDPDGPGGGGAGGYVTVQAASGTCPVKAPAGAHGATLTVDALYQGTAYGATDGAAGIATPASGTGFSAGVCTPTVLGNNQCGGCVLDGDCPAAQPVCDPNKNSCGVCSSSNQAACTGATPACDTTPTHDACAGCNGNFGSAATRACPAMAAPSCVTSGPKAGACVACALSSDCVGTTPVCSSARACVACDGDKGTTATSPCPTSAKPYCQTTGACSVCASSGPLAGTCGAPDGGADAGDGGPAATGDAGDSGEGGTADAGETGFGDAGDASAGDASEAGDSTRPDASDTGTGDANDAGDGNASDARNAASRDSSDALADVVSQFDAMDAFSYDVRNDAQTQDSTADGAPEDSGSEVSTPSAPGSIAGGGLSCSTSRGATSGAESSSMAAAMVLLLLVARRRTLRSSYGLLRTSARTATKGATTSP